jgi:hypothetical protein
MKMYKVYGTDKQGRECHFIMSLNSGQLNTGWTIFHPQAGAILISKIERIDG